MKKDAFYDAVAREIQSNTIVPGVWAKAFSEAGGDMNRARALYIEHRVVQMEEVAKQESTSGFRRFVCMLLTALFGLLTSFFAIGSVASLVRVVIGEPLIGDTEFTAFSFIIACVSGYATRRYYRGTRKR